MNNQFTGPTAWKDYLAGLESATPAIEAIAVTDYYVTGTYEQVLEYKKAGRLPTARLIFPNVELRLDVATAKGGFVNMHLFVSPEDANHIAELQRFLSRLHFTVQQDRFDCTRAELIRLGKKTDPTITDDRAALAYGANQYKVNFSRLRDVFAESGWAQTNIVIAVAGGAKDGTSGVREAAGAARVLARRARQRRPQAGRCRNTVRRPFLMDQGRAGFRLPAAGLHRSAPSLCRHRATDLRGREVKILMRGRVEGWRGAP